MLQALSLRSRCMGAAILVAVVGGVAPAWGAPQPPPRPSFEERQRLIQAHPVGAVRAPDPRLPASGQEDFDVVSYDLAIAPSAWSSYVDGTVSVTFVPAPGVPAVRELVLDLASNMFVAPSGITRRRLGGIAVPFSHEGDVLRIDLAAGGGEVPSGTSDVVTIEYSGYPVQAGGGGLQFSVFGRFPDHVPSIYSLSQPFLARTWWPCKDRPDDKATVLVRVDVPVEWEVVSNGTFAGYLASSRDGNRVTLWRERHPIATYLVSVAISDYETCEAEYVSPVSTGVTMPMTFWAWPSRIDQACDAWGKAPAIMTSLATHYGEYPFISEKYGHVAIQPIPRSNPYVAMENQTVSSIGSGWLSLSHDSLIAHEMAHQWWGNSVTPRDFDSIWLSEGMATHAEALWWESQYGLREYQGYMRDLDPLLTLGDFVGPVHDPIDENADGWPDGDATGPELTVYFKGAWVMHMLRWVLAQPSLDASTLRLDRVLAEWRSAYQGKNATTDDFVAIADRMATDQFGMRDGLQWFFDQWLLRDDRPCYRVAWSAVPSVDPGWTVQIEVEQAKWGWDADLERNTCAEELAEPYRMPVPVRISLPDGSQHAVVVDSRERRQSWQIQTWDRPSAVTWDAEGWILKGVQIVDADADDDGWLDVFDSCPLVANPEQEDANADGQGDACQPGLDGDGDGIPNEADCAPADGAAWTPASSIPPVEMRVSKGANGLVVRHGAVEPASAGERGRVLDVAQGRLDRLWANGWFRDAECVETGRIGAGELTLPWSALQGNRYVVLLPYNGCGPVDPLGRLDDPCR